MPRTKERNCSGCRYWSEMIARAGLYGEGNPLGDLEAMCLNENSPRRRKYTTARATCEGWAHNEYGAVDEPPDYGAAARACYAAEDRKTPS